MNSKAFEHFEVPKELRVFAEKSMEEAKKAFDGFVSAAAQATSSLEGRAAAAQAEARDVTQRAMSFAEQNVASSFDFAQKLIRAKDVAEVMKLHADYVRRQIDTLSEQAKELGETAARMARTSAKAAGAEKAKTKTA